MSNKKQKHKKHSIEIQFFLIFEKCLFQYTLGQFSEHFATTSTKEPNFFDPKKQSQHKRAIECQ